MEHAHGATTTLEGHHRGGCEGEAQEVEAEVREDQDAPQEDAQEAAARRGVGVACNFCRRSHTLCETKRPCTRCEKAGRAHLCADVPLRKRGRPRRSDNAGAGAAADVSAAGNGSNPKTTSDVAHRHQRRLVTTATPIPATAAAAATIVANPQQMFVAAAASARLPPTSGFDSLPFYALSPRSPAHHDAPSMSIRQQHAPPQPPPLVPRPPLASTSGLYANALDMMSDELRRARDENEKLRARLKRTKAKLKLKKFEAMQLRHSLERELEDKARRLSSESEAATSESTARAAKQARIVATPASMRMASAVHSFSSPSPSSSSSSSSLSSPSDSSHSPPTHTSPSSASAAPYASSLAPYSPPPASVSSYSTLHEFPLTIMQHVHEHMPFLAPYIFSPRDFVIQDLRVPFLSIWSADWAKPYVTYSNSAFNQLLGFAPDVSLAGYPLLKLWADTEKCEAGMEALMRNKPPMYISEFIFADPLLRSANGSTIRVSFVMQFFFDSCGMIEHGVACVQSWRFDGPRKGESFRIPVTQPLPEPGAADAYDFGLVSEASSSCFASHAPLPDGCDGAAEVLGLASDWSAPASSQQCQFQQDADRMLLEDINMLLSSDETSFLMRP